MKSNKMLFLPYHLCHLCALSTYSPFLCKKKININMINEDCKQTTLGGHDLSIFEIRFYLLSYSILDSCCKSHSNHCSLLISKAFWPFGGILDIRQSGTRNKDHLHRNKSSLAVMLYLDIEIILTFR